MRSLVRSATVRSAVRLIPAMVIVALVSGCFPLSSTPVTRPTSAGVSGQVPAGFERYYEQQVSWQGCDDGFECATVTAPINWAEPDSAETELALIRHRAEGESLGALFMNPGGPGASGYEYVQDYLDGLFGRNLITNFDIVGFDPRGVGQSSGLECLDDEGMDRFLFDLPTNVIGSDEYVAEVREAYAELGDACVEHSGELTGFVDTVSVARDLDLMRALVGDPVLNYLGFSYGTKIGAIYAGLFPQNVGRLVLDGVVDPSLDGFEVSLGQMEGFDGMARAYLSDCLTRDSCPFAGSVSEVIGQLQGVLDDLAVNPLTAQDGRRLGSSAMLTAVFFSLYQTDRWEGLSLAIVDVLDGDPEAAFVLIDSYYDREDGVYLDNSNAAFYAVQCLDYPTDFTAEQVAEQQKRYTEVSEIFGKYYADGTVMCDGWPLAPTVEPAAVTASGAAPIMVVGTTGDPATPYAWSQSLASTLESGFLVTLEADGHTAYSPYGNACIASAVEDFLLRGTVPDENLVCR